MLGGNFVDNMSEQQLMLIQSGSFFFSFFQDTEAEIEEEVDLLMSRYFHWLFHILYNTSCWLVTDLNLTYCHYQSDEYIKPNG